MEIELLKKSWESLDKRMQNAATFNEKLVETIISSRAMTTVDKIKKLYASFYVVLTVELIFLIALFLGNPFDFQYEVQYVPYALILVGVIIAFVNLIHIHKGIRNLSPGIKIDQYLRSIISIYDRNKRFEKWFGMIFLSVGLLVPFSFLPTKIDRLGLSGALIDTGIMISITLIIFLVAHKLGAFNNPYKDQLQKDLKEWSELKGLVNAMEEGR
jgi:hypothetical protein